MFVYQLAMPLCKKCNPTGTMFEFKFIFFGQAESKIQTKSKEKMQTLLFLFFHILMQIFALCDVFSFFEFVKKSFVSNSCLIFDS